MHGHPMTSTKKQTTTEPPIYYPTGNYIRNPLFDEPLSSKKPTDSYALDMDLSYDDKNSYPEPHHNHLPSSTNLNLQFLQPPPVSQPPTNYLSGPMVVRVHPDGSPVMEDKFKPLPKDDDRDEMTLGRDRIPTMEELATSVPQQQQAQQRYAAIILPPPPSSRVQPPHNPLKQQYNFRLGSHRSLNSH